MQMHAVLKWVTFLVSAALLVLSSGISAQPTNDLDDHTDHFHIYVPVVAPYVVAGNANIDAEPVRKAMQYLKSRDLDYEVIPIPWTGAMKRLQVRDRSLILPLDRTADREENFHWLAPVTVSEYYLYGVAGRHSHDTTLEDVKDSNALISCGKGFAQCDLLTKAGIKQQNILHAENSYIAARYRLMVSGRIEFTVFDPVVFEALCKEHNLDPTLLVKLEKIGEQVGYLAASGNTPSDVIDLLTRKPG